MKEPFEVLFEEIGNWFEFNEERITFTGEDVLNVFNYEQNKIAINIVLMEWYKSQVKILLEKYSKHLEECGYLDTDWWSEEPTAVNSFIKDELK